MKIYNTVLYTVLTLLNKNHIKLEFVDPFSRNSILNRILYVSIEKNPEEYLKNNDQTFSKKLKMSERQKGCFDVAKFYPTISKHS